MHNFIISVKTALRCRCPKCNEGALYQSKFDLRLNNSCNHCGLDLTKNDSADGPAVFLIFVLGFLAVPLALWADSVFSLKLWVHALLWSVVILGLTVGLLKPLKSYVILLQYRFRKSDWRE